MPALAALSIAMAGAFGLPAFANSWADCRADRVELRGQGKTHGFWVELADSQFERARGLMFRESLSDDAGMLFVYDQPRSLGFWMENTLIPLDIIYLVRAGQVMRIHENAVPGDRTVLESGPGAQFVLEINGGLARKLGIGPGDQLRHPAIGPGAAWPCPAAGPASE